MRPHRYLLLVTMVLVGRLASAEAPSQPGSVPSPGEDSKAESDRGASSDSPDNPATRNGRPSGPRNEEGAGRPQARSPKPKPQETPQGSPSLTEKQVRSERELKSRIESRAGFIRNGDLASADAELAFILESRQALGIRNVVVASAALIREARQAEAQGHVERAVELAETAARLSPDLAAAHWLRTRLYLTHDLTQIPRIVESFTDFVRASGLRLRNSVTLLLDILAALALAMLATAIAFAALQLVKYGRYLVHDVSRILSKWFVFGESLLALFIFVAAPFALGYGIALSLSLSLLVVFAYQTSRERAVSVMCWVAIALTPLFAWFAAPLVAFHGSIVDSIDASLSEAFASDAEVQLFEAAKVHADADFASAIALAQRYRMRGELKSAESEYRRALDYDPQNAVARNNLGTLLYQQGLAEAALVTFQSAASHGRLAEPILNYASMLVDSSQFKEADEAIERARRIDRRLTDSFTRSTSSLPTMDKLLNASLEQSVLWARLFDIDGRLRMGIARQLSYALAGHTPMYVMPFVVLAIMALASTLARARHRQIFSVACRKCGAPARADAPSHCCVQCQSLFLNAVALEPALRIRKEAEVERYQQRKRWTERVLSILAGGGDIFAGRPWFGTAMFFLFALALSVLRFTDGFVAHPWSVGVDETTENLKLAAAGGFAGLLALLSLYGSFR